ncbi:hypothetical protein LMH73_023845 [Vibrio splendidus]|nr:hypothetical protein [Vibrio splendidus]MCC4883080.1 hypothetical protein [Vibrio splendidus]
MATNGVLSIVQDGKTLMRLTAGFNGYEAPVLRSEIESNIAIATDPKAVFELAQKLGFGCKECLVLLFNDGSEYLYDDGELSEREHKNLMCNFDNPEWNARCSTGYADYVEVIHI